MLKTAQSPVTLELPGLIRPSVRTSGRLLLAVCGLLCLVYAVSLLLPAYGQFQSTMRGYETFLSALFFGASSGFLTWIYSLFMTGWVANPVFWAGTLLLMRGRLAGATILGVAASLLAIESARFASSVEAPLLPGYYVWLCSMGGLAMASLLSWHLRRS